MSLSDALTINVCSLKNIFISFVIVINRSALSQQTKRSVESLIFWILLLIYAVAFNYIFYIKKFSVNRVWNIITIFYKLCLLMKCKITISSLFLILLLPWFFFIDCNKRIKCNPSLELDAIKSLKRRCVILMTIRS